MSQSIVIPQDIIDNIIHELSDSSADLKQCCLVSQEFLQFSQRQLFSTIRVDTEAICSHLHSALICNPHLASYIRSMAMDLSGLNITEPDSEAIVSILQNLRDQRVLRSLQFVAKNNYPIQSQLWSVLLDLFKLPCLVSLDVQEMHPVPLFHLRECRQLKKLSLVYCSYHFADDVVEVQLPSPALPDISATNTGYLDSLRIWDLDRPRHGLGRVIEGLGRPWCLSHLRELSITDDQLCEGENVREVLTVVAPTLRSFEWFFSKHFAYPPMPLHLMRNLRSLCCVTDSRNVLCTARVIQAIRDIPPGTMAEGINVTLCLNHYLDGLQEFVTHNIWSELESALMTVFVRLRRVAIFVDVHDRYRTGEVERAGDMISRLSQKLPLLHEAGILYVGVGLGWDGRDSTHSFC